MPKGVDESKKCIVCNKHLGVANKHGYCFNHRHMSDVYKQKQARANTRWWFKNNQGKTRIPMTEEQRKEKAKLRMRQIRSRDREAYRAIVNSWDKLRRDKDPNYRIACNLRSRLSKAISQDHKKGSAVRDLGCTLDQLRLYIENQFVDDMSWSNYGHGVDKWNIDHIRPLSSFDLTDPEQLKIACHYTNLQPMWHLHNISKGNRYDEQVDE